MALSETSETDSSFVDVDDDDETSEAKRRRDLESRLKQRHYKKDSRHAIHKTSDEKLENWDKKITTVIYKCHKKHLSLESLQPRLLFMWKARSLKGASPR
jgi:hypothetical protein